MDAEVEPMPVTDNYAMDVIDFDGGIERGEIITCKGLGRNVTSIQDLRPSDTTKHEYSYRPILLKIP